MKPKKASIYVKVQADVSLPLPCVLSLKFFYNVLSVIGVGLCTARVLYKNWFTKLLLFFTS